MTLQATLLALVVAAGLGDEDPLVRDVAASVSGHRSDRGAREVRELAPTSMR